MENALIALAPGLARMVELGFIDTLWEWLTVVGVVTLGALGLLAGLLRGRGGSARTLEREPAPPVEYQRRTTGGYTTAAGTRIDLDATREDHARPATPAPTGSTARPAPAPVEPPLPELDEPVVIPDDLRDLETAPEAPTGEPLPQFERPADSRGRLRALRARLARSNSALGKALLGILSSGRLDDEAWEEVEDTLLASDLGVEASTGLVERLRTKVRVEGTSDPEEMRRWLRDELVQLVDPTMRRGIAARTSDGRPAVILVVGVNGTGKTTTVGKLARVLVADERDVLLGAADTFRAAAADQLQTWGERVGVATVRSEKEGADPASVAYEAVRSAQQLDSDVVVIDTAGRLHNKAGLMDELSKIKRVIEKLSPIDEVLLVLDATTGQNGMKQAEVFAQAVDVTGIVLTKLDGTAKGGIVVAVQQALGVPVKLVGLGEGPDDLAPFIPEDFVDALLD